MNEDSLKSKLKVIAKEKSMTFNQMWKQLLLERFLARLANSDHQDKFIFKGGLLLANYLNIGRETTDIDFSLTRLDAEAEKIKSVMLKIVGIQLNDGITFEWDRVAELTQPHMEYSGFRIFLHANFGNMVDKIQIDIGLGDVVLPQHRVFFPYEYKGKPIFAGEISLLVYPPENIFAEKLESIISRGALNSRMKDYHDVLLMKREVDLLDMSTLRKTISNVFNQRVTNFAFPMKMDENGMQGLQRLWTNHLSGLGQYKSTLNLPKQINVLMNEVGDWLITHDVVNNN